jgi:microsomal dipeptidase-like Zn-dependent dipeptidase
MRNPLLGLLVGLVGLCAVAIGSSVADAQTGAPTPPQAAPKSPLFQRKLNAADKKLRGFVEMHTHPMAHLGFGGKMIHGAPGVGVLMPAGAIYYPAGTGQSGSTCNPDRERAASVSQALGSCYSTHGGHDFYKNKCGNHIRRLVLDKFEDGPPQHNKPHNVEHPHGYPDFTEWPKYSDILHQQMWVDWIKRAYDGGLRVMVGLALNSYTLATAIEAPGPTDDKESANLQIEELERFVNQHQDWMKIARSPAELRNIVGKEDKLAVIMGVELDDLGDFSKSRVVPSAAAVRAEIRRLHAKGVRYVFPVHVIDNVFGGSAVYEDQFNRANCFQFGDWWQLKCATTGDGINKSTGNGGADFFSFVFSATKIAGCADKWPVPICRDKQGKPNNYYVNQRGLQAIGKEALDEMMRLGMIIDIDHGSRETVTDIFTYTQSVNYPLVSGHNGLFGASSESHEAQRTKTQYQEIARRGGIVGVGWGNADAERWLKNARAVKDIGIKIALGSDINGMVEMPAPRAACRTRACVTYSASFPQAQQGNRKWNYNTEGVAHIGLFPDALRDAEGLPGGLTLVDQLFDGAEGFASMWEGTVAAAKRVKPAPPAAAGELGMPCKGPKECSSGLCDSRAGCVPQASKGKDGDFCTDHKQCTSGACNVAKTWISGKCTPTGSLDLGQACNAHQLCRSGLCDPRAGCVPKRNGQIGAPCTDHKQCTSGLCNVPNGRAEGKCTAPASLALGQACNDHRLCSSSLCDPRAGCVPNRNGSNGNLCTDHKQCTSGLCNVPGGKAEGKCTAPASVALGQACNDHRLCSSGLCDPRAGCVPNRNGQIGATCTDHRQCTGGLCNVPGGKAEGKCTAPASLALGQACNDPRLCRSGLCDPRAGCVPNRNGNVGDICTDHAQCASGLCNVPKDRVDGKCTARASLERGQGCNKHEMCRSGRCDARAGCVP